MKNVRVILIFSFIGFFFIAACSSEKNYAQVKLSNKEDSVSYYLGVSYGSGLKQSKIDSIFNSQAFLKGMNEAINSDTLPVSQFMIQTYLNSFFMEFQTNQLKNEYKDYIAENKKFLTANAKKDSVVSLPNGLQYVILRNGNGNKPTITDRIRVHYSGTLIDGTVFDSSYGRNEPAEFNVGEVIPGWTEIIQLMPVGSKWRVYIPEDFAYGSNSPQGSAIKPYSTLIFVVELLEILPMQ